MSFIGFWEQIMLSMFLMLKN